MLVIMTGARRWLALASSLPRLTCWRHVRHSLRHGKSACNSKKQMWPCKWPMPQLRRQSNAPHSPAPIGGAFVLLCYLAKIHKYTAIGDRVGGFCDPPGTRQLAV